MEGVSGVSNFPRSPYRGKIPNTTNGRYDRTKSANNGRNSTTGSYDNSSDYGTGRSAGAGLGGVGLVGVTAATNSSPTVEVLSGKQTTYAPSHTGAVSWSEKSKAKMKEEMAVSYSESDDSDGKVHHKKKHADDCGGSSGAWIVWIVLIFIIILFIVMGCFWFVKPDCVTRDCDDGNTCKNEFDIGRAGLYAFVITFFLIIIILGIWWCACK